MRPRILLAGLAVAGLMSSCAAASPAADRDGGWTHTGTVIGKGYDPPRPPVVECFGRNCRKVPVPECWRLDLQNWLVFHGWACADKSAWDRAALGDYWGGR